MFEFGFPSLPSFASSSFEDGVPSISMSLVGDSTDGFETTVGFESPGEMSVGSEPGEMSVVGRETIVGFESPGCATMVGFAGAGVGISPVVGVDGVATKAH